MKRSDIWKKKRPKPGSLTYYIEAVIGYRTKYEAAEHLKDGYPPVMAELLLSLLISVRVIRRCFAVLIGAFLALAIDKLLTGG